MSNVQLLIVILVVLLFGGVYVQRDGQPYYGVPHFGGLLGVVAVVLLVLLFLGRL